MRLFNKKQSINWLHANFFIPIRVHHQGSPVSIPTTNLSKLSAFTLVELLTTLTVLGLLLLVAIPGFRTMLLNSRMTSNADSLVNALNYARSIALNDNVTIKICPIGSLNSTSCGSNWTSGWIVITQPASGSATLLKSEQNAPSDPTITASANSVLFDPHGLATTQNNFTMCDARGGSYARSVSVLATGYVQSGAGPGIAVWNNGALSCP